MQHHFSNPVGSWNKIHTVNFFLYSAQAIFDQVTAVGVTVSRVVRPHFPTSMIRTRQSARKSTKDLNDVIYESEFSEYSEHSSDEDSDYGNCA